MALETTDPLPCPHSFEWYDRLSQIQDGYFYPWKSNIGRNNGEKAFHDLLFEHLSPDSVVLDVGCGHGELTMEVARQCRTIYGYDRAKTFVEKATKSASKVGLKNCYFVLGDSSSPDPADQSLVHIPIDGVRFDLVYSRRGPINFIQDAKRVAQNPGWIIQLLPAHANPPPWVNELPVEFRTYIQKGDEFGMLKTVSQRLTSVGLQFHSYWFFDVPEYLENTKQLFTYLSWNYLDKPPLDYDKMAPIFERIFAKYSEDGNIEIRHRRFLWTCHVKL